MSTCRLYTFPIFGETLYYNSAAKAIADFPKPRKLLAMPGKQFGGWDYGIKLYIFTISAFCFFCILRVISFFIALSQSECHQISFS